MNMLFSGTLRLLQSYGIIARFSAATERDLSHRYTVRFHLFCPLFLQNPVFRKEASPNNLHAITLKNCIHKHEKLLTGKGWNLDSLQEALWAANWRCGEAGLRFIIGEVCSSKARACNAT